MCAYTWLHVWYDCFIHICALMCVLICWCTYAKHNTCMLTCIYRRLRCAHVCTATLVGIILSVWLLFLSFVFVSIRWSGYVLFSKCVIFHSSSVFHSLYDWSSHMEIKCICILAQLFDKSVGYCFQLCKNANEKKCSGKISALSFLCDFICSGLLFSSSAITRTLSTPIKGA